MIVPLVLVLVPIGPLVMMSLKQLAAIVVGMSIQEIARIAPPYLPVRLRPALALLSILLVLLLI
jgi:hypothetical protein